jgi:ArsR family transcriptional regulator
MQVKSRANQVDSMFRAFSDRTRLRILHLLRTGETCVCDLQAVLDVPQPKVSRHLAYLRRTGLVKVRKEGLWSFYTLAPARNAFHSKLLECLGCCFKDVPVLADDAKRIRRSASDCSRGAGCCSG